MPSGYRCVVSEAPTYCTLQNVTFSPGTGYFESVCGMNAIVPGSEISMEDNRLYLNITEQPADTFRYRYKSEKGSHGGIKGVKSLIPRAKKSFPTVKLENCPASMRKKIVIQVSLYTNEPVPKPHVYELTGKNCSEGKCEATLNEDFMAVFQSLAISTRKKEEVLEILKQRKIAEYDSAEIAYDEEAVKAEVSEEMKGINLDSATLCFEAFSTDDTDTPLCEKVFSNPINNQKSAASGDLKIVRISQYAGKCSGDEEIWLLCEKVNKGDIKVRFFDEGGWEDFGVFNPVDVHYQVAIVFKTPKYYLTDVNRKVSIELYRPSDGKRSEPRQFEYKPDDDRFSPNRKLIAPQTASLVKNEFSEIAGKRKRPKLDHIADSYLNSSSVLDSPESVEDERGSPSDVPFDDISDQEWNLFPDLLGMFGVTENADSDPHFEAPTANDLATVHGFLMQEPGNEFLSALQPQDFVVADSAADLSLSMNSLSLDDPSGEQEKKMQRASKDFMDGLNTILRSREETTYLHYAPHLIPLEDENGNSMLHLAILEQNGNLNFIMKMLQVVSEDLINKKNKFQETPLHLAAKGNHLEIILLLLIRGGNPNLPDADGNNLLHLAAKYGHLKCSKMLMLPSEMKRRWKHRITDVDVFNYDGMTALHIAISRNFEDIVNLLLNCKADVNLPEKKCGRTSLHMAVEHPSLLPTILKQPQLNINAQDFRGYTGVQLACMKTGKSFEVISDQLKDSRDKTIQFFENIDWNARECSEVGFEERSTDSSDFEDAFEDLSSIACSEVIYENVPANEMKFMNEKKSNLMRTEEELQKYLDANDNWKKLADLIDLNTECVAMFDKGLSPGLTVIRKIKDLYHPCDLQPIVEILRLAGLGEGVRILQRNS